MVPKWTIALLLSVAMVVIGLEHGLEVSVAFGAGVMLFGVLLMLPTSAKRSLHLRLVLALALMGYLVWRGFYEFLAIIVIGAIALSLIVWSGKRLRR